MATPNFFIKNVDGPVRTAIQSRTGKWTPVLRATSVGIKINDIQYFPTDKDAPFNWVTPELDKNQNTHLTKVSVTDSGDYMTARKCELSIECNTRDAFEYLEKDFGFIDSNKKLFIRFYYTDQLSSAEDTGWMEFRILEPSFSINEKGHYVLSVKGIGAGSTLYNINMKDVAFMRFPQYQFVYDYSFINDTKPVETLTDFFEWTIQSQTGELTSTDFDPEHGSNGKIEDGFTDNARWLTLGLNEDFYEADWQGVATQGATLSSGNPSIRYVTLAGIVQTINKYFIPDTNGGKPITIRCNKDITRASMKYKTKNSRIYWIFSANPKLVIFPLNGDGWKGDYSGAGDLIDSLQVGSIGQVFEFSKHSLMAPLLQACDMSDGDISGMLISLDLIRLIFEESLQLQKNDTNNKKDVSKLSMDTFFRSLFDSVKELSGGAIDLKLLTNSELTTPTNTVFDIVNTKHVIDDKITPILFGKGDGSTLTVNMQSKITQDLITAAYGDMPGTKGDESANQPIISGDTAKAEETPEGLPNLEEIFDVKSKRLAGTGFSDDGVQAAIGVLKRLVSDQAPVDKLEHTSALYPIELSIKLFGIAGLRFGDCFTTSLLPSRYKKEVNKARVIFTVYEVDHQLENGWYTTIKGMLRLAPADTVNDVYTTTATGTATDGTNTTLPTNTTDGTTDPDDKPKATKPKATRERNDDLETT